MAVDRLEALLDAAVDAMILIDSEGCISRFNRAAERVFGYASEEVLGHNVKLLMPNPYRDEHDGYIHRYLTTSEPRIIGRGREVVACRKDGSPFPIDLAVGEFRSHSEHGFVGILRDITQRKTHEAELRRNTHELQLIFANTPTALTITDAVGRIINVNHAAQAYLGCSAAELAGKRHSDLIVDEERDAVNAQLVALRQSGDSLTLEVRYRRTDGSVLHALLHAGVIRDDEGRPMMMIVEIIDRTALLEATSEAEALRARLAHAGRLGTLGEMCSGIAHEVNQPLTAIANYANAARRLLQNEQVETDVVIDVLRKIALQAGRAGQVIHALRSMARRRDSEPTALDCNALIQEVLSLIEHELRLAGWRIQLDLADSLPPVIAVRVQLQQVVLNLIQNAMESMNARASGDFISVSSSATRTHVDIHVDDHGPGLSEEAAQRLFEPFFTTKPQGMGLGLSICKSIVAAHHGELTYRQNTWGGAGFNLRLPVASE